MSAILKASTVDDRRRVVLPESFPPNSPVIFQQVDADTWIVQRARPQNGVVMVAFERIERLPDDPDWEQTEKAVAESAANHVPPPAF